MSWHNPAQKVLSLEIELVTKIEIGFLVSVNKIRNALIISVVPNLGM